MGKQNKERTQFLAADWRYLAMLNYEIEPSILSTLVPRGTELDTWQGKTFVSMVGFRFLRTRLLGIPIPFHQNFDEVNLRFYVRREQNGVLRRGVVFIREIVPRHAIAFIARLVYNEPYIALPMQNTVPPIPTSYPGRITYAWRSKVGWNHLAVRTIGMPEVLQKGSEAEFITEHYWGYTRQRNGSTIEYEVAHPRWRVWNVAETEFVCDVAGLYGTAFTEALSAKPHSVFLAEGSAVTVFMPGRL